ncbi:MAG: hypothetical protein WCQ83_04420 [Endomicrobiia bacterium]
MRILFCLFLLLSVSSCAVLDYPKRLAGYSTASFETEKNGRFVIKTELSAQKAYNKCNLFLFEKQIQTNFKNDKKMYVVASKYSLIYEYCLDSTEVGFFVHPLENETSEIEVISNNTRLAKFVYQQLSEYIKK